MPQVVDTEAAEELSDNLDTSLKITGVFLIQAFLLVWLLAIAMEQIWGAIRTIQVVFLVSLINFTQTIMMAIFLGKCAVFATLDLFSGEDFYGNHLSLKET